MRAGLRLDRRCRQMARERACTRNGAEEAEHVARERGQTYPVVELTLDIWNQSRRGLFGGLERCGCPKEERIDSDEAPGFLIRGSAHHHAIEDAKMRLGLLQAGDPPIEHDVQV